MATNQIVIQNGTDTIRITSTNPFSSPTIIAKKNIVKIGSYFQANSVNGMGTVGSTDMEAVRLTHVALRLLLI